MYSDDQEKIPFIDGPETSATLLQRTSPNRNGDMRKTSEGILLKMENLMGDDVAGAGEGSSRREHADSTLVRPTLPTGDVNDISYDHSNEETPVCGSNNELHHSMEGLEIGSVPAEGVPGSRNNSFKYPIHSAAEKGKVKLLERLLIKGDPLHVNFQQKTPLHYACGYAYQKKALQMVEIILNSPQAQDTPEDPSRKIRLINYQDKNGETGLHIAARTGHRTVVEHLLFAAADVNIKDKNDVEPLQLIYSKVPAAMKPVFDGAVEILIGDPYDQNLIVRFDFGAVVGYPDPEKEEPIFDLETKLLSYSLQQSEQKRSAILLHPLVQTFLHLKWKKIRILLWISILYHMIWLLLYTIFICDLYLIHCPYKIPNDDGHEEIKTHSHSDHHNSSIMELDGNDSTHFWNATDHGIYDESNDTIGSHNVSTSIECEIGSNFLSSLIIWLLFLFGVTISVALKELYEIWSSPQLKYYFMQLENVGQWILIAVVILTSIPMFMKDSDDVIIIHAWQYQFASLGIFLAWSLILSQIGKIPRFGIYIEVLAKVIRSFTMFMITFASLLVAFMVSFQILMPEKVEFENFPLGFIKVLIMMIGEINYDEMFFSEEHASEIPFPSSTKLLYAAFVAVVTIILFNLLIGLTVSDIAGLQDVAQLSSLSSQVEQIYLMEKFIMSKKVQRRLIRINKNHWLRYFLVTQQTDDKDSYMGVDLHISKVPRHLQFQVREIAAPNVIQQHEEDDDENQTSQSRTSVVSKNSETSFDEDTVDASLVSKLKEEKSQQLKQQIKDILKEILEELKDGKSLDGK